MQINDEMKKCLNSKQHKTHNDLELGCYVVITSLNIEIYY